MSRLDNRRYNAFTESERATIRREWGDEEVSLSALALRMGRSVEAIKRAAEEMGLGVRPRRTPSTVDAQRQQRRGR